MMCFRKTRVYLFLSCFPETMYFFGASNCWTRQMKDAFGDLQNSTVYRSDLFQCRKLNISNLRLDLRFRHQVVWREAHGQDPCSCF